MRAWNLLAAEAKKTENARTVDANSCWHCVLFLLFLMLLLFIIINIVIFITYVILLIAVVVVTVVLPYVNVAYSETLFLTIN